MSVTSSNSTESHTNAAATSPSDMYVVFELYHNPHEYSSLDGKLPILKAICPSLEDAAEFIATNKINEMHGIVQSFQSKGMAQPFAQNLFVSKVPLATAVNVHNLTRIPVTEAQLTQNTKVKLHTAVNTYNQVVRPDALSNGTVVGSLQVDPSSYEKDRRAREWEQMHRMNVRPLWATDRMRTNVISTTGRIPQPAQAVSILPANPTILTSTSSLNRVSPAGVSGFVSNPTPSLSAPPAEPGRLPVASETPNPVTTSVPLAPVTPGSSIDNFNPPQFPLVSDSLGHVHPAPPTNTATSAVSRVTS